MEQRSAWPWFAWVAVVGTVAWAVVMTFGARTTARAGDTTERLDSLEARIATLEDRLAT